MFVQIDPNYVPAEQEYKDVYGITFEQGRNNFKINEELLNNIVTENKELPQQAKIDMIVSLITLKSTQSNSVCYVKNGQAIGVGAGQQSRIHCTRLAGNKADNWYLRQHPRFWVCSLSMAFAASPTVTMQLISTPLMNTRIFWQRVYGKTHSR